MERLWETDQFVDENTLTVNINRLRKKLDSAGLIHFITTKFGVGYLIESLGIYDVTIFFLFKAAT